MITEQNNFIYLCLALILWLLNNAMVAQLGYSHGIFALIAWSCIALSIKSLHTGTAWRSITYVLLLLMVIAYWVEQRWPSSVYFYLILLLVYFIGSFRATAQQVLFKGRVDFNTIIGSISLYLLLGLIWSVLYLILLIFDHQAFSGIEPGQSWQHYSAQMSYYSFVTLTTLGYGDILPKNAIAAFLAYMEAITGVFYMAIVVASLVSISLQQNQSKD